MADTTLEQRREQMVNFLLENIVCSTVAGARVIERKDNDIIFVGDNDKTYWIRTLSRQMDLPYEFEDNSRRFDEDGRKLRVIYDTLASMVAQTNQQGFIPGFVLLRADSDFTQLERRTEQLVNHGHFLKQKLPDKRERKPNYNHKALDPIEVALMHLQRQCSEYRGKRKIHNNTYHPALNYFNPKKDLVEVVWFADLADPSQYKDQPCPVCTKKNEEQSDHASCKESKQYLNYVLGRDRARYEKLIDISKVRRPLDSHCKTEAEKGAHFIPANIQVTTGPNDYIAVIK